MRRLGQFATHPGRILEQRRIPRGRREIVEDGVERGIHDLKHPLAADAVHAKVPQAKQRDAPRLHADVL